MLILGGHRHPRTETEHQRQDNHHRHGEHHDDGHRDQVLWSAYLHVLADALTSLLAVFALLAGKYLHQGWLDPFMGIIGAALVVRWSWGLLRSSSHLLLDMRAPEDVGFAIKAAVEKYSDNRVSDLHAWAVGPGIYAAAITVVTSEPQDAERYWALLPPWIGIVHLTVEVRRCAPVSSAGNSFP